MKIAIISSAGGHLTEVRCLQSDDEEANRRKSHGAFWTKQSEDVVPNHIRNMGKRIMEDIPFAVRGVSLESR